MEAPSGKIGGTLSHEYHLVNPSAEGQLQICTNCNNAQIYRPEIVKCHSCNNQQHQIIGSVEVAHTFNLMTKYSKVFDANDKQNKKPYFMCCFGMGLTRLIAAR